MEIVNILKRKSNSLIRTCDERIERYKALLEYQMSKGSVSLLNLNSNTKIRL